jgi:hypothetical protein
VKKANPANPTETAPIIKPKVERAMIFLKSYSKLALNPAINIVKPEKRRRKVHH